MLHVGVSILSIPPNFLNHSPFQITLQPKVIEVELWRPGWARRWTFRTTIRSFVKCCLSKYVTHASTCDGAQPGIKILVYKMPIPGLPLS